MHTRISPVGTTENMFHEFANSIIPVPPHEKLKLMQNSAMVLNIYIFPPIGVTAFPVLWQKLRNISQTRFCRQACRNPVKFILNKGGGNSPLFQRGVRGDLMKHPHLSKVPERFANSLSIFARKLCRFTTQMIAICYYMHYLLEKSKTRKPRTDN